MEIGMEHKHTPAPCMTTTVLTDDAIHAIGMNHDVDGPYSFARAIEQAVLQSPEVQAWKKDAERYRATRAGLVGTDPDYGFRFSAYCDVAGIKQRKSITEDQFDAATDAAMDKQS